MKIILDIMPLGAAYASPSGRTGVFRVTENLIRGLLNTPDCDVSYIATRYEAEARKMLEEDTTYKKSLSYPTTGDRIIEKIRRETGFNSRYLLPSTNLQSMAKRSDIYHSTFRPVPEEIKTQKRITPFLTVHDIIPLLFPQYFENNSQPLVKLSIESIIGRGWIFCVSEATKMDLCNYYKIEPERVFISRPAASPLHFYPEKDHTRVKQVRQKYSLGESPYFLSLCTFEPRKNISLTIKSFSSLIEQEHLKDVNLVLIGSKGWDYKNIFDEISKTPSLKSRIIVTGFVDDSDLAALYSEAYCFIYPSFYEGFGLPPLEAMQCGVPVITSNTSSLPEVAGDAGIMIDPRDSDELAEAMLKVSEDSGLRKVLSDKSLARSKEFTWENFTARTVEGYAIASGN